MTTQPPPPDPNLDRPGNAITAADLLAALQSLAERYDLSQYPVYVSCSDAHYPDAYYSGYMYNLPELVIVSQDWRRGKYMIESWDNG